MRAAQINEYGDASVVHVNEVDIPTISDGKVLVEVHAASLNPFDTSVRAGYMKEMIPLQFPTTIGGDIAGVVTKVTEGVSNVAVGDKVYGQANAVAGNSGAFAEFAATSANEVAKIPEGIDFKEAASLALAGVSAVQAINHHIQLQPGQKLFINGGAGAIGANAIQIAKGLGAYVAVTATSESVEFVKQLGADEVVDYKTTDFTEVLSDYDAVFDTVGGEVFTKSLAILKQGGIAVSMAAQADEARVAELGVTAISQQTRVTTELLDELSQFVEAGTVRALIDKVFSLDQIKEAFEAREAGDVRTKIVIEIK
jgi:alcohol dehydrogenase